MKKLLITLFYLCICMLSMNTQILFAQGTKGNVITFNSNNSTMLFADITGSGAHNYSCYLRHNQAPIQVLNANPYNETSGYTIAPLQTKSGTGTGFFANSSLANNMGFSSDGRIQFFNFNNNQQDGWPGSPYKFICVAVIAPRGYRFTEYYMDIDGSQNNGANGATIMRYTYNANSTYEITECTGEELSLTRANSQIFNHTLSKAENMLYFRIEVNKASTKSCITMNQLKLTYVIDGDIEATIPNNESSVGTEVHTGYIKLGRLSSKAGNDYYFNKNNVTDLENVNIVAEDATSEVSVVDGVINVSKGGTYWIESPAKFRITEAKLNFQLAFGSTTTTWEPVGTDLASILGKKVKISDGKGNFLVVASNGSGATNTTNVASATTWYITAASGTNTYYIRTESGNYLCRNSSGNLTTQSGSFQWTYYTSYNGSRQTSTYCFIYNNGSRDYGIRCYNNTWAASRTDYTGAQYTPTPLNYFVETIHGVAGEDAFTATLYGTSATQSVGTADINTSNNPTASISATGLNNDGVKFTVTGKAGFTVDLKLEPLDPNLQNLEFGYKMPDDTDSPNLVSASATDFKFNNGETIVIPIVGVDEPQVVFRNAFNENRRDWYNPGSGTKLSNYYLIDSQYEQYGSENTPSDKVNADQAGTTKIEFSNIKTLTARGGTLTETTFNKNYAGYNTITLTTSPKTVYIYSADKPEYCIMTDEGKALNNHIAYTFYDAKLQGVELEEEPVITVTPLYTSSLKRNNVKVAKYNSALDKNVSVADDSNLDEQHTFYGIKVNAKVKDNPDLTASGYLTSTQICDAIKDAMGEQDGFYENDVMRSILYVDMSELKSISVDADTWKELMLGTADNCLYFMPSNFSTSQSMLGGGIIAGGANGIALTDIIVIDQQPFFTPYNFRTSTHVANYVRKQTYTNNPVQHSTLVLPFTLKLNDNGNLKPTSDSENTNLTFYNLGSTHPTGSAGNIDAIPVSTGEATANIPYHIKSAVTQETTAFEINTLGATFVQTPLSNGSHDLTSPNSDLTAHGSFNGVEKSTQEGILYFSKEHFLNSANLTSASTIKILPYRAYYTTSTPTPSNVAKFSVLFLDNDNDTSEESLVSEDGGFIDAINNVENENAKMVWYNMNGQKMNSQPTLPGVYVVNGKKVLIKK